MAVVSLWKAVTNVSYLKTEGVVATQIVYTLMRRWVWKLSGLWSAVSLVSVHCLLWYIAFGECKRARRSVELPFHPMLLGGLGEILY